LKIGAVLSETETIVKIIINSYRSRIGDRTKF